MRNKPKWGLEIDLKLRNMEDDPEYFGEDHKCVQILGIDSGEIQLLSDDS